jgi:plasmid stability protein
MSRQQRARPDDQVINLWLDHDLYTQLGAHATEHGTSMTETARQALREHLARTQHRHNADQAFAHLAPALRDHIDRDVRRFRRRQ